MIISKSFGSNYGITRGGKRSGWSRLNVTLCTKVPAVVWQPVAQNPRSCPLSTALCSNTLSGLRRALGFCNGEGGSRCFDAGWHQRGAEDCSDEAVGVGSIRSSPSSSTSTDPHSRQQPNSEPHHTDIAAWIEMRRRFYIFFRAGARFWVMVVSLKLFWTAGLPIGGFCINNFISNAQHKFCRHVYEQLKRLAWRLCRKAKSIPLANTQATPDYCNLFVGCGWANDEYVPCSQPPFWWGHGGSSFRGCWGFRTPQVAGFMVGAGCDHSHQFPMLIIIIIDNDC